MIYVIGPGHGGPGLVAQHLPGRPLHRTLSRHRAQTARDCSACSASSPGRTAFRATSRPKRPARSMKAANWAIRSRTPMARRSTIRDLIVACIIGDGEAETGALAASWHSNKFLNPARDGAVLPILHLNGYKIANPTRAGAHRPRGADRSAARLRLRTALRRRRRSGRSCIKALPATLDTILARIRDIQSEARRTATPAAVERPRWPHDRVPHAQGLDGAEIRRRQARRRHVAGPPGADRRFQEARTSAAARRLAAELPPARTVRRATAASATSSRRSRRPAIAAWAPIRTPTAASCWSRSRCRISATTRSGYPRRASVKAEATRVLGEIPARRHEAQSRQAELPAVRARRDRLQPAGGGVRGVGQGLDGRYRRRSMSIWPSTAGSWRC